MNTIKVAIATTQNHSYYYNLDQNKFQNSNDYSISDNPEAYDVSGLTAAQDAVTAEFGALDVTLELREFNLDTLEFVS